MPSYKLCYFNAGGRAELVRWVFEVAGIEYEDFRFKFPEWQAGIKAKAPFKKCPWLEVDGERLAYSTAIARFVAKRAGLAGGTDIEQAKVDMVSGYTEDAGNDFGAWNFEKDPAAKEAKLKKLTGDTLPRVLGELENMLSESGNDYFVGNKMTYCDMHFTIACGNWMEKIQGFNFEAYPKCMTLREHVQAHPKIAAWIQRRPADAFM